jgi:hypothetical protein
MTAYMTTGNAYFEREVAYLVQALRRERDELKHQASAAHQAIESLNDKLNILQEALAIYNEHSQSSPAFKETNNDLRMSFSGLSTKKMLVQMAKENSGVLDGVQACHILVKAGMFKDYRNASSTVYSTLSRNPEIFQRIGKAKYKLVEVEHKHSDAGVPKDENTSTHMTPLRLIGTG